MELLRALAALAEPPRREHGAISRGAGLDGSPPVADHTGLFVLQLPPYASLYLNDPAMLGGEARDRMAGFWRALDLTPPPEPDHLTLLLACHAGLVEREGTAAAASATHWRRVRHAFFWEHLASWVFPYLSRLLELAPPFYRSWGTLLWEVLAAEVAVLGPPAALPAHLRAVPAAETAPAGSSVDEIVAFLLTPVRSGLLLTRADLVRASREVQHSMRLADRRHALRGLLIGTPDRMLDWLQREAQRQAAWGRHAPAAAAPVTRFWMARAAASVQLVTRLHDTLSQTTGALLREPTHA